MLEELDGDFAAHQEELIEKLKQLTVCLFRPENLMVDYTAQQEGLKDIEAQIAAFRDSAYPARPYRY